MSTDVDSPLEAVAAALLSADPSGERTADVFRNAFDYLYDGQRTGRYRPDQLSKTEKTHCGSLVEIYLRRALDDVISDGDKLDFRIAGAEIDCKFSLRLGGWMLPPECFGELILVTHADDFAGVWSLGLVRATDVNRSTGRNRDAKTTLSPIGRGSVTWLFRDAPLPPNALLALSDEDVAAVFSGRSGQKRVNELFRRAQNTPISRTVVATVAQQDDFMKRVRANGGARSALKQEGYLIPSGDYEAHRQVALDLGAPDPAPGEFVSFRVVRTTPHSAQSVELDGQWWRIAILDEVVADPAPSLPTTKKS